MNSLDKKSLFWDVDNDRLSLEKDWYFIIERILEFGDIDDVLWMESTFPREKIAETIKKAEYFQVKLVCTVRQWDIHLETIDESMLALVKRLGFLQQFSFYLAGGTGLALQIGHRKSFDMDFFTPKEFVPEQLFMNIKAQKIKIEGEMRSYSTLYPVRMPRCLQRG